MNQISYNQNYNYKIFIILTIFALNEHNLLIMKTSTNFFIALCCALGMTFFTNYSYAQAYSTVSTLPAYAANNSGGLTVFNLYNSNPYPIIIDTIYAESRYIGNAYYHIWYNNTPVLGPPALALSADSNWIPTAPQLVNIQSVNVQQPVMVNVGLFIPAGDTVGIGIGGFVGTAPGVYTSVSMDYHTITTGNSSFTTDGVSILMGDSISYASTSYTAAPSFNPRGFSGSIVFRKGIITDTGIDSLISPRSDGMFCSGQHEVKVRLRNFGTTKIDSVQMNWTLDGIAQTGQYFRINPPLDSALGPNPDTIISLGMVNFSHNIPRRIKAWTEYPNNHADENMSNDTLDIIINSQGDIVDPIQPRNINVCMGDSVTLDAQNPGSTYLWNTNDTSRTISFIADTSQLLYSVKVENAYGCSTTDSVRIAVKLLPVVDLGNDTSICEGKAIILDAGAFGAGTTYRWNTREISQQIQVRDSGVYSVVVTSSGCEGVDSLRLSLDPKASVQGIDTLLNANNSYTFSAIDAKDVDTYHWDFGDGITSNDSQATHGYAISDNYTVTLIVANDCGKDTAIINVEAPVGIEHFYLSQEELKLYPNPAFEFIKLENNSNYQITSIEIYNVIGQNVVEKNIENKKTHSFELSHFSPGIYHAKVYFNNGAWIVRKFEVRR